MQTYSTIIDLCTSLVVLAGRVNAQALSASLHSRQDALCEADEPLLGTRPTPQQAAQPAKLKVNLQQWAIPPEVVAVSLNLPHLLDST